MKVQRLFQLVLTAYALTCSSAFAGYEAQGSEITAMFYAEKSSLIAYRDAIGRADSFAGEILNPGSDVDAVVTVLKAMRTLHHEYRNPSSTPAVIAGERGMLKSTIESLSRRIRNLEDETRKFGERSPTWGTVDTEYGNRLASYLARVRASHGRAVRTERLQMLFLRESGHATGE